MTLQWNKFRCAFALAAACIFGAVSQSHSVTWQTPVEFDLSPPSGLGFGTIGSDSNGNAIVLIEDDSTPNSTVLTYRYTGGAWVGPQTLFTETVGDLTGQYSLSMIPSGQAMAVWADTLNPDSSVYSAFFNGINWSTPTPNPIATLTNPLQTVAVSMNDSTDALLVTMQAFPNTLSYATFSGGAWSPLTSFGLISASNFQPIQVSLSDNGTAVAAWYDSGSVIAANYIGGVWATTTVGSMLINGELLTGIDSNGHGIAIWTDPSGNVVYSYWNGTNWFPSPGVNVSTVSGNAQLVAFSMAPGGTAVAAWLDSSNNGIYSTFNGSTWATPAVFTTDTNVFSAISIATDPAGNALIMYTTNSGDIDAITLPLGGSLSSVEVVTSDFPTAFPTASLSANGVQFAFLSLQSGESGESYFGTATLFVPPPSPSGLSLSGSVCKNKFATQIDLVKTIQWAPLQNPNVASYTLTRNGALIATFSSSGPFVYRDHNRCKKGDDIYVLTARNAPGIAITSATIVL